MVNAVLLRPLPYSHPEQFVRVYTEFPTFPNGGLPRFWTSAPEFFDLRRDTHSWATLDAWQALEARTWVVKHSPCGSRRR